MLIRCKECRRYFKQKNDEEECSKCQSQKNTVELKGCRECHKLSNKTVENYCYECAKSLLGEFKVAKDFLYKFPKSTMKKVSEETGIGIEKIQSYVKEGKLDIVTSGENKCAECSKVILSGTYCSRCKREKESLLKIRRNLNNPSNEENKSHVGMHILKKDLK